MTQALVVDTGPLVAFVNARDRHHEWALEQLGALRPPLITCDAVLAEACYLLRDLEPGSIAILALLRRGLLTASFRIEEHVDPLSKLITRYASMPMDLADACLVRITELHADPVVITLDSDFRVYRRHGRQKISTIMPS